MRDHGALGHAGRPRGVDQRGQIVRTDLTAPLLAHLLVDPFATGQELIPAEDVVFGITRTVEEDDLPQMGYLGAHLQDLVQLLLVLDEDHLGVAVVDDVGTVLGEVRGVDAYRDGTGAHDPEVAEDPLQPGLAENADAFALLDPQGDQRLRGPVYGLARLLPRNVDPRPFLLVLERHLVRMGRRDTLEQLVE